MLVAAACESVQALIYPRQRVRILQRNGIQLPIVDTEAPGLIFLLHQHQKENSMLHLLVQSFLWPTDPGSGILPPALSKVLDGGGGGLSGGTHPFLDWDAILYQVSLSYVLVVPTEYSLVPV